LVRRDDEVDLFDADLPRRQALEVHLQCRSVSIGVLPAVKLRVVLQVQIVDSDTDSGDPWEKLK
jgi:hypothetical protein